LFYYDFLAEDFDTNSLSVVEVPVSEFELVAHTDLAGLGWAGEPLDGIPSFDIMSMDQVLLQSPTSDGATTDNPGSLKLEIFSISLIEEEVLPQCDFTGDSACTIADIDLLIAEIAGPASNLNFDLNDDQVIDLADRDQWLSIAAQENGFSEPYLLGDANLDGVVAAADLNTLGTNWRQSVDRWSNADFNADGVADAADLNLLGLSWQQGIAQASAVPEPPGLGITAMLAAFLFLARTRAH
jgi:hypothetical protein